MAISESERLFRAKMRASRELEMFKVLQANTNEPGFTGIELAKILGLELNEQGEPEIVDLINACWAICDYEVIDTLSPSDRGKVYRTAVGIMDIFANRGMNLE